MQVDPIKPTLKPPGSKRLKLEHENTAFKFCFQFQLAPLHQVYVSGEEMTRYTMQLILDKWVSPHVDTSKWESFDLRAKNRDDTSDQVLKDVITAGARLKAIFKVWRRKLNLKATFESGLSHHIV